MYNNILRTGILLTLLLTSQLANAQVKRTWNWYFGQNAAVEFSTGVPLPLTNNAMNTHEGNSTMSDDNGNLLMYSDGSSIWDRTHTKMPNGTGLLGHSSSTMSALIVPKPQSPGFYYVFSCDAGPYVIPPNDGINYTIVDMSLNGGLGDVVPGKKNIPMLTPATEKLVATRHGNGCDYWVISTEWLTNNFYAWQVTDTGVMAPVVSSVGTAHNGSGSNTIGLMQITPDGKRIALTNYMPLLEIYDFDPNTGIVSNPITLRDTLASSYGIGWSPDGTKLYDAQFFPNELIQYDVSAGTTAAAILATKTVINNGLFMNSFQIGPDSNLYIASSGSEYLHVINDPNVAGTACNFQDSAVYLAGRKCALGLPNMVNGDVLPAVFETNDFSTINTCIGSTTLFADISSGVIESRTWDFGDPGSGSANNDTAASPSHLYTTAGTYTVELILVRKCKTDTVTKTIVIGLPPVVSINDTSLCDGNTITVDAGISGGTYTWSNGDTTQVTTITHAGPVFLEVTVGGCVVNDTFSVNPGQTPTISAGADLVARCEPVTLEATSTGGAVQWMPTTGLSNPNIINPIASTETPVTYVLTVTSVEGCPATDSVRVTPEVELGLRMPNAFSPNGDGVNDLIHPVNGCIEEGKFRIVNRYGRTVFLSEDLNEPWDGTFKGKAQPLGTYVYHLVGTTYAGDKVELQGNITLLR